MSPAIPPAPRWQRPRGNWGLALWLLIPACGAPTPPSGEGASGGNAGAVAHGGVSGHAGVSGGGKAGVSTQGGAAGALSTGGVPASGGGTAANGGVAGSGSPSTGGTSGAGGATPGSSGGESGSGAHGGGGAAQGGSAGGAGPGGASAGNANEGGAAGAALEPVADVIPISSVWSGHPVKFALVTRDDWQFAAFYDQDRKLTVAARTLARRQWDFVRLPTTLGWDSHNSVAMAVDENGFLHVSGNMHNVPLIYFRSTKPFDIQSFEKVASMVGSNEQSCTYPEFFHGPDGDLIFAYRDGGSGNGNHIFNIYDAGARRWERLLDTPLTDGEGQRNAYPVGPIQGPDGYWHLVWVWRDTPDAATNHDLSYARTRDLVNWESGAGQPLALPIRLAQSDIVDPVPARGGMINNNTKVGFDSQNRPVIVYHKYDASGATQLYNARLEDGRWVVRQTSDWDYRWDFGGNGTLVFEIEVEGVAVQPDGTLTQRWYHARYGGWGAFRLDEATLAAVETIEPPLPYPRELDTPLSPTPGMIVRWQADSGRGPDADVVYMLRWETLESNRDMPRDVIPPPTELSLYALRPALANR
ncbi:MAG TPA: BNR-4 repeat-containing protein [Polyangiaceae bacterium]|nr:BNR-4 repeat-containing protein [Polyangiaceae bacterium]